MKTCVGELRATFVGNHAGVRVCGCAGVQVCGVSRPARGLQGLAGLRDRPLRAKLACGDLAGGRARRRPEHQRCRQAARPRHAETPPRSCGTGSAHPVGRKSLNESDGESHLRVTLPPASSISALQLSTSVCAALISSACLARVSLVA